MNRQKIRLWVLGFSGVALATSITGAEWAIAFLILETIANSKRDAAEGRVEPQSPLGIPILLFLLWGVIATTIARHTPQAFGKSISHQSALVLFWVAAYKWTPQENDRWLRWFLAASVATGIWAIVQVILNVDRYPMQDQLVVPPWLQDVPEKVLRAVALRNERAVGTRSHPLTFAEGLFMAFVVWVAIPMGDSRRWRRFRWWGLAVIGAGIVFSQSRAVWVALAVSVAVYAVYWRDRRDVRIAVALGLLAIGAVGAVSPKLRHRAMSIFSSSGGMEGDKASREVRFKIWAASLELIKERPITGMGIKGVKLMVDDPLLQTPRKWTETHNIFLQVACERGLVGLGLFLWILVVGFRCMWTAPPGWREAGVAVFAGLLIAGLTESWIKDKEIAMIFWAVLGAVERRRIAAETGR